MSEQELSPEAQEVVVRYLTNMANNVCPVCEQTVTKKVQVGRCVYNEGCGHRMYQGSVPRIAGDRPPRKTLFDEEE